MLRRCLTLAVSCCFVLALAVVPVDLLFAQGDAKKEAQPPAKTEAATKETPKPDATKSGDQAKKPETAKDDAAKKEPAKPAEPPLPPIPPEVQAKIDAARKAVAEMIVYAQDAGLIESSIDPPPILDLLIDGRVTDARTLKAPKQPGLPYGVSPEVFGAWFTGYGKMNEINYVEDVRIRRPIDGLKQWYDQREDSRAVHSGNPKNQAGPRSQESRDQACRDQACGDQACGDQASREDQGGRAGQRTGGQENRRPEVLKTQEAMIALGHGSAANRRPGVPANDLPARRAWHQAPADRAQHACTSVRSCLKDAPVHKNKPCIFRFVSHSEGLSEDRPTASRLGPGRRTLVPRFAPFVV